MEMRPDLPSLKLPRMVSQGLAGAEISSSRPPSKRSRVPGSRRASSTPSVVRFSPTEPGTIGMALGGDASDDLDGQQGDRPMGPAVDAPLGLRVALQPEPADAGAGHGELRHAASGDVDLHDPADPEGGFDAGRADSLDHGIDATRAADRLAAEGSGMRPDPSAASDGAHAHCSFAIGPLRRLVAAEKPSTRGAGTQPPNSCQTGVGVGATTHGIEVPMPVLRQQ